MLREISIKLPGALCESISPSLHHAEKTQVYSSLHDTHHLLLGTLQFYDYTGIGNAHFMVSHIIIINYLVRYEA